MKLIFIIAVLAMAVFLVSWANAREIGFIEDFSLSRDRSEVLKQLIPGTNDYYYYHCLHAQHTGDFEQVHKMLGLWIKRQDYTPQVKEILNRQALLEYQRNPEKSLEHIRKELNLRFDHRKEIAAQKTNYPSELDQKHISISALTEKAFSRYKNLQGIEDAGLDILRHEKLSPERRRDMLQRLQRPDIPNLPKLVVDDLRYKHSSGFGSFPIHRQLLKSQLDECLRLMPELTDNSEFITTYLSKLGPSDDADIRYDPAEKKQWLDRLWTFVKKLAPAHNSLKAHILCQILEMNRKQGNYDHDLFMEYIRLPRNVHYVNPDYVRHQKHRHVKADLNADFSSITQTPPVGTDEALIRDYLSHYFLTAKNYKAYIKFIKDTWLKEIFAETKIINGLGDMEQWYSMMDPAQYQALKARVDLDFLPVNKPFFATDEPVTLDLYVKNVKTLLVKIFELNTFNYYQTHLQEVDTAINLDGLTATREEVITYEEPPLRRIRRSFEFPQMNTPGVFVVEFIGNGKSSRAVIRKGKFYVTDKIGPAGHELTVRDEMNQKRKQASVWLAGRDFTPDEEGVIIIPFSNNPGLETIIVKDKDFCSLASFDHMSENYRMQAGFYADRESLLRGFGSKVVVRPVLTLNGHPVSLSLLENVRLVIDSVDRDGVSSVKEVSDFEIFEDKESVFEFQVPDHLTKIGFTLKAQVQNMSRNKKEDVSDHAEFSLNSIDSTMGLEDIFLSHADDAYIIELLGKNGELKPNCPIRVELKHRYFRETIHVPMQTDDQGRIHLGKLEGIERIQARGSGNISHKWRLAKDLYQYPNTIHEQAGETIRIPYVASVRKTPRLSYTLFEKRGQTYVADYTGNVQICDGFLEIRGIPAGNYDLFIKESNRKINLRLTEGKTEEGFVISKNRVLEIKNENLLQISSVKTDKASVRIQLSNASSFARVHVLATCFMPSFDMFSNLVYTGLPEPYQIRPGRAESQYVAGRNIGDEYRYILERKYAEKFPGNMLNRPELLLNPWNIRKTETARDEAAAGEPPASESLDIDEWGKPRMRPRCALPRPMECFSNLDFLNEASVLLLNLRPDENGLVTIERNQLGAHRQLHCIAIDPLSTVYREITLPDTEIQTRDLRLVQSLEAEKHFTEQKQISLLHPGETFRLTDMTTSDFEVYDSLDKVYQLLVTLSENATLQEFNFILRWPEMDEAEKQEKYSKYACHELSFFIYHKDQKFFEQVILPYLRNKKDKTFLDHWLLGEDLTAYLEPWAYSQLNIVEKILLARRGPGGKDRTARSVKDLYDMIPPDIDEYNRLFDTALKGSAFEEDSFGFAGAKEEALEMKRLWEAPAPVVAAQAATPELEDIFEMESDNDSISDEVESMYAMPMKKSMRRSVRDKKKKAIIVAGAANDRYFTPRDKARKKARQFFRQLDKTEEWVENNYYKLPIESQNADLITVNAFWNDYAQSDIQEPFLSKNIAYASRNFAEMMLALSVLDIPFKAEKHETTTKGVMFSLKANSHSIVFHKEIREGQPSEEKIPLLVSQHFFRADDRYYYEDNERFDKFVEEEFLVHTGYGCQMVLSNPTSSRGKLRSLLQIPRGAIPLNNGFYTKGIPMTLEPYTTRTFEYYFYFPETGKIKHYPAQIARNEEFVTSAPASEFNVVAELSRTDTDSWEYVSQHGTEKEVLAFLNAHNLNRLDLNKIAFRMKEKAFFKKITDLLRERHTYQHTLWSYSIYHNENTLIAEYLRHSPYAEKCGDYIETPILSVNPVERKIYQHMEYRPLVNARAHQLGKRPKILNDRFYDQYHRLMQYLSYRSSLNDDDLLAVTYYLLLQDRVSEAIRFFERITPDKIQSRMQYDYVQAYLDFYTGDIERAGRIASEYLEYPVARWQNMFQDVANQLDELEGKAPEVADKESRDQIQTRLAATETSFDIKAESRCVTIDYQNLSSCRVNYYPMDIELLFSRNPFVQQETGHFSFIRPNDTEEIELPSDQTSLMFELPEKFHNSNLMIEIVAQGMKKSQVYYANSLDIQLIEKYGYLKVAHQETHKPLAKTYVKVYAQMRGGDIRFYKDGYTDLRGRFDYVSLNTNELDNTEKFAILILSEEYGAVIREVSPPKR
ncbi:hypothetical protein [Desulfonema magnum]|uniref:Uncharacterized protein n=1 Tax=Desulfonema magnum TaxID=45655 RepID=A0A975BHX7_9BACT|nr:hypothetical protein [Desulfonema magnum]QTA85345.1 Uncharacterized protein dnm_013500 [Desulfonema magnum]